MRRSLLAPWSCLAAMVGPALVACSAPRAAGQARSMPTSMSTVPEAHFALHTRLQGAPVEAGIVRLELPLPAPGAVHELVAVALVGNAPFEVRLKGTEPGRFASEALTLEWMPGPDHGSLVVETHGRCPELGLRFAAVDADRAQGLCAAIQEGSRATVDGRPCPVIARLERVR